MKCRSPQHRYGFTLIEVMLAIGISVGLLIVALVFYQQAAHLRNQLLEETEKLSAIRLAMDRMTTDLRTVVSSAQQGFFGTATSLQFARGGAVDLKSLGDSVRGRGTTPVTELRLVSYRLLTMLEGTNAMVQGMERTEEPLFIGSPRLGSVSPLASAATNAMGLVRTNTSQISTNMALSDAVIGAIRQLRLRYWNGSAWMEDWNEAFAPPGVEITLSSEPKREEASPMLDETEEDVFRRVVYLPGGQALARGLGGVP